jgi:dienelactone hydrolase
MTGSGRVVTYRVADVPALVLHPEPGRSNERLALWMHFLGADKERMQPALEQLAAEGFTAVSLDAWQHGERSVEPVPELMGRVFGNFRANMWPILGRTVLDAVAVVDHALATFDVDGDVVAGGVSMGGDIAVALAGTDTRVSRVAAMIATPDWARPGMAALDDPDHVIDQGDPTRLGQWLYEALDPMTHPQRYVGRPEIAFDLGGDDRHIPRANAVAFCHAVRQLDPAADSRIRIRVHGGLDHLSAGRDPTTQANSLAFLSGRQ